MPGYQTFATEEYFARYEFAVEHLLAASNCETVSIRELLGMSGGSLDAIGDLRLGYTEPQGAESLRTAIAAQYEDVEPAHVVILGSPIEGIYLTMRSVLDPGDEVVVLAPSYDALRTLPEDLQCDVRYWYVEESDGAWRIDLDALSALLTNETKLVVLNFPHNPTGYQPTLREFEQILGLVSESGAWLYHDEIFRGLEHGDRPRLPSAADRFERSLVLNGLSKTHGLPGLRAGWLIVRDANLRAEVLNTKMYTSICPPAPIEYLAEQAVRIAGRLAERNRDLVRQNLALAEDFFDRHRSLFRYLQPLAGPVGLMGINVPSAHDYCERLASEHSIMLLPSGSLGLGDQHVRIGFGLADFANSLAAYDRHLIGVTV